MTISTTTSRAQYAGNGVTTIFSFPYRFLANGDLEVTLFDAAGTPDPQTLTTDYTVLGADNDAGGSVTMLVAPAVGETLVIRRVAALTQETDYISGDSFPAETHERALDRLTMVDQQMQEQIDRSITVPLDNETFSGAIPAVVAGGFWRINDAGTGVEFVDALSVGELVVSPFIETLLDDANAAAARATLVAAASGANSDITSLSGLTTPLSVGQGGTGQTTAAGIQSILPIQQARVDVASAGTVNLTTGAASTDHVNITGTTTITGFTVAAGRLVFVRFAAALTLTNNASIVTQTGANITTGAGDTCILRATASNTVEVLSYVRASAVAPGYQVPTNVTGSRAVNTDYTNTGTRPRAVWVYGNNGTAAVLIQVSYNGGSTWMTVGISAIPSGVAPAVAFFFVPPGSTYRARAASGTLTITEWWED